MVDILAFPNKPIRNPEPTRLVDILPTLATDQVQSLDELRGGNAGPYALAMCANARKPALSELPDAAWVIGTGMRWITRRGRKRSSLPKLVSNLLEQHCDAGNPAAILFRDWIDCRLPDRIRDRDFATAVNEQSAPIIDAIRHGGE